MNPRKVKKHNKLTILKNVIKPLKKKSVLFDSYWFENGYFIFNFGDASVCKFKLKGLPQILFGIWNVNDKIEIFGEDIVHIDKFKPSRCVNFTVDEIAGLYKDYINNRISLQDIVMDIFGNDYDDCYYHDKKDHNYTIEESKTKRISKEEFDKVYAEQYRIEKFKWAHSWMTPDEFERCDYWKNFFTEEFKNDPLIKEVYFIHTPEFFKDYGSFELYLSEETYKWSDDQFDEWYENLRKRIEYGDDTKDLEYPYKKSTGLSLSFTKLIYATEDNERDEILRKIDKSKLTKLK